MPGNSWSWTLIALGAMCCCGCGEPSERLAVSGLVYRKGVPLERGEISFLPLSNPQSPASMTGVVDGAYTLTDENGLFPGRYRVVVRLPPPGKNDPPIRAKGSGLQSWDFEYEVPADESQPQFDVHIDE